MTKDYDYFEAVKEDCKAYLKDTLESGYLMTTDTDEIIDEYLEDIYEADSVTGNASGSYTFSTYQAEENLCHNWDALLEALEGLGYDEMPISEFNPEELDVLIRIFYLQPALEEAIEELKEEM